MTLLPLKLLLQCNCAEIRRRSIFTQAAKKGNAYISQLPSLQHQAPLSKASGVQRCTCLESRCTNRAPAGAYDGTAPQGGRGECGPVPGRGATLTFLGPELPRNCHSQGNLYVKSLLHLPRAS